jgi:hypothetical protein
VGFARLLIAKLPVRAYRTISPLPRIHPDKQP